jgi:DNA-binding protein H-NS
MTNTDLSKLSLEELTSLKADVDKAIQNYETRKRNEALAAAEAAAQAAGYSLSDLMAGSRLGKKKTASPPKYQHPENPELTWSGRGRQPRWLKEAVEAGQAQEEFLINKR